MNSSNYNLEKPENLLTYMTPGVYQILCVPSNTIYIGITQNILERFGKHSVTLAINRHDCAALQEDWRTVWVKTTLHLLLFVLDPNGLIEKTES